MDLLEADTGALCPTISPYKCLIKHDNGPSFDYCQVLLHWPGELRQRRGPAMLPEFSHLIFEFVDTVSLKQECAACVSTERIQLLRGLRAGIRQIIVKNEEKKIAKATMRDLDLAMSLKKLVLALHCALNGIPFDENSPLLAVTRAGDITPEMAAEYKKTFQMSVKAALPDFYEAVLQYHYPSEVRKTTYLSF